MNVFKFLSVCFVLFACSKPKVGEIGNYQVALGDDKADFYVLMWKQNLNLKKSKVYTSYSNGALHTTRGVLSGKALHGIYKEVSLSGALLKVGKFRKGLKDGYWAFYNEDGSLINDLTYSNGDTSSVVKFYNKDGLVKNLVLPFKRKKKVDKRTKKWLKKEAYKEDEKKKKEACRADKEAKKELKVKNKTLKKKALKPDEKSNKFKIRKFKFKTNKRDSISDRIKHSSIKE